MDTVDISKINEYQAGLIEYAENNAKDFFADVKEKKMWTDESEASLKKAIEDFTNSFKS